MMESQCQGCNGQKDETDMTERRLIATNQLSSVITALQLGRKTGILTVERGEDETFEEGTITFLHGQAVQAASNSYSGRDAATKLFSWQTCRFAFAPLSPQDPALVGYLASPSQTYARIVAKNTREPFDGNQQTNLAAQGDMSRRPSLAIYQGSMNDSLRMLDRQGLSRTHRHLFLLIDGRRSIKELAVLIGRSPDETVAMLDALMQAGLIRL
jgi:hypothetical protein